MTILDALWRWLRGEGATVLDLGALVDGDEGQRSRVAGRVVSRGRERSLLLEMTAGEGVDAERRFQGLRLESVERLLEVMADVGWRVAGGHGPRPEPGARVAAALMGLAGMGIVHTWEGVAGGNAVNRGRRLDLHLVRGGEPQRYLLFFSGRGAGLGLWPAALADALLERGEVLRRAADVAASRSSPAELR